MLMEAAQFELLSALEEVAEEIRAEAAALRASDYVVWPDRAAYTGTWLTFPLALRTYPDSLVVDLAAHRALCPQTSRVLDCHPRIFAAGFSRMEPGCHILPHVDKKEPNVLRAHLALKTGQHSVMRVAESLHHWVDGQALIFDALIDHETINLGSEDRLVLMFDFEMTEDELAYAKRFNSTVDPRFFSPASVNIPFGEVFAQSDCEMSPMD